MMKVNPDTVALSEKAAPDPLQDEVLAAMLLRDAAVRVTAARVKVLSALLGAHCAFSHQDMQDRFVDMDRVTLYRALDCLADAGLAHKIAGDDRVFRYSVGTERGGHDNVSNTVHRTAQHRHGHFKCTRCAKVFCLDSGVSEAAVPASAKRQATIRRQLQSALQENLGKGFQSHDIELTIKGWCADCTH